MSTLTGVTQLAVGAALRRFSVSEYHRMIEAGILDEDDAVELLDGYIVLKMPRNPPHDTSLQRVRKRVEALLPSGLDVRIQCAVTLPESEPEPDVTVVQGDELTYATRHPGPGEIELVVEVADSTLQRDRNDKGRIYARAGIPIFWIVNLVDRQLEVNTTPSATGANPGYTQHQIYGLTGVVSLVLNGKVVGGIPVRDLFP